MSEPLRNLIGKTFAFLVCVEKQNICDGKDSYRVAKVLCQDGLLAGKAIEDTAEMVDPTEQPTEDSAEMVNPSTIVSGDQVLSLYSFLQLI